MMKPTRRMNAILRNALAVAGVTLATQAMAQVTFYEREGFTGQSFTTEQRIGDFERFGFNDRASSVIVAGNRWEVCEDARFRGRCVVLRPGRYASLGAMGLNDRVSSARTVERNARIDENRYAPAPAPAPVVITSGHATPQITFFEREGFGGQTFTTEEQVGNFARYGFNDRASSVVVVGDRWEVCEDVRFGGRCVILRPGRYASLAEMGLNDRISSVRMLGREIRIDERRYAPAPVAAGNYSRRNDERLYEASVTSVRAVVGPPERRCWIDREQVVQNQDNSNAPAVIAGAILGGVLGHQVGGGRGQDIATAGGAIAGAAVGANLGRSSGQQAYSQDVEHCRNVPSQTRPEYWNVTYNFQGTEHRIQMSTPPGATVTVNGQGEPRS